VRQFLIAALVATCAAACGTPSQVTLDTGGLKYESGGIRIAYKNPAQYQFVDARWKIDNWMLGYYDPNTLTRKLGTPFEGVLRVDMDNDGRVEDYSAFFTDLELRHSETEGQIWVLMRELPRHRAEVKLDVLIDDYAERLSFEEYTRTGPFDVWLLPTRKYAARVVSKQPSMLGPFEAMIATIEIANLAQLQLDPNSRMGFVRVLMARVPGFTTNVIPLPPSSYVPRSNVGLLVVGYYDSTAYFEKGAPDFEAFLEQFTVNGRPVKIERFAPVTPPAPPAPASQLPAPSVAPVSTPSTESTPSTPSTPPTGAP
jgi:hypothetical protein